MTRYTPKKRSARKNASTGRQAISPSLKGAAKKDLVQLKALQKRLLARLKALQKQLKEARALSRKPKSKKAPPPRKRPKKARKAKEPPTSPEKRRKVKKPPPEPKKRPKPKRAISEPKKRPKRATPEPKKRPEPKKPPPEPKKPPPEPQKPPPEPKKPKPKKRPQEPAITPQGPSVPVPQEPAKELAQEPTTQEPSQEPPQETFEEGKKRFEELLREFEKARQEERSRREKADRELSEQFKRLEEERAKIIGPPAAPLPPPGTPPALPPLAERLEERFGELLEIAEKTGQIPIPQEGSIDSEGNFGESVSVPLKDYLTEETLEEMIYRVEQAAKKFTSDFPIWITVFVFSAAGKELVGYGIQTLLANDVDALKFQAQGIESTGIFPNQRMMLDGVRVSFEELLDLDDVTVYMHFATIKNYRPKGVEEQRKWRKEKRERYREEKAKKQETK